MENLRFVVGFLFIFGCLVLPSHAGNDSSNQTTKHVAIFVFGDSLFDAGNNNFLNISISDKADRWPYGETFFHKPTGRFCDGRDISDFIAGYANLPMWRPYLGDQHFLHGANFACGGAGILKDINPGNLLHLSNQLDYFKDVAYQLSQELGENNSKRLLMEAVYLFSIGGVDCLCYDESYAPPDEYIKLMIGNFTDVIQEIYNMGGRKFAFQNAGPIGCFPNVKQIKGLPAGVCDEEFVTLARLYNSAFLEAIEQMESQLQGFKYLVFDYFTLLSSTIENPTEYGFKEVDVACCGYGTNNGDNCGIPPYNLCSNVSEYVYFDGEHPTEKINARFANYLWNGEPPITAPYNFKQLLEQETLLDSSSENHNFFNAE